MKTATRALTIPTPTQIGIPISLLSLSFELISGNSITPYTYRHRALTPIGYLKLTIDNQSLLRLTSPNCTNNPQKNQFCKYYGGELYTLVFNQLATFMFILRLAYVYVL